ncbi:Cna B-type domain-containing protein [Bifidobacterium sp. SO1]|uniref:Cna B-type domain-containing protein n=1 Tax=Bifidobacterium sp. SO1 TaxID=2809029 RepID=UPI001BDD1C91|nr:Cna B-type domain-containing protein [Bifidobacterium sp. SO1]
MSSPHAATYFASTVADPVSTGDPARRAAASSLSSTISSVATSRNGFSRTRTRTTAALRTAAIRAAALLVALATLLAGAIVGPITAQAATQYTIGSDIAPINKDSTSITINGKSYTTGMKVNYNDPIHVDLHWTVSNDVKVEQGDTFTYDLPAGLTFESGKTYVMYGDDGTERGTFVVNGSRLTATYTRAEAAGTDIKAYVKLDGVIAKTDKDDGSGGKKTFEFPGIGNLEFDVKPIHQVTAHKSGAVSTNDPSVYYFVVDVTSNGTNDNVRFNDTMGDLLTYNKDVKIYTDANCTQEYTGSWSILSESDHAFSVNVKHMDDGQTLYVKYGTTINRKDVVEASKKCQSLGDQASCQMVNNKFEYYSDDDTNHKTTEKQILLNNTWGVTKTGTQKDGKLQWTIVIQPGDDSVTNGFTIKDVLGAGLVEPSDDTAVKVRYSDNKWYADDSQTTTITWGDLKNGTAKFPYKTDYADGSHKPYARYEIIYTTAVKDADKPAAGSGESKEFKNNYEFNPGDGSDTSKGDGSGTVTDDSIGLSKQYVGDEDALDNFKWVTTFTAKSDLPAGAVLTDRLDCNGSTTSSNNGTTTVTPCADANIVGDYQQFPSTDAGNITIYTDAARTQRYDGTVEAKIADDLKSFTLTFKDKLDKGTTLYIAYSTRVKDANKLPADRKFYNTAISAGKTATATHQGGADNMNKSTIEYWDGGDPNGAKPHDTGIPRWKLHVHDISANVSSVVITDTMPKNTTYVSGSLRVEDDNYTKYSGVSVVDNGDGTLTFTIAKGSAAFARAQTSAGLNIIYDTKIADMSQAYKDQQYGWLKLTNSAKITVDGKAQIEDHAEFSVELKDVLTKDGKYDKTTAPYINYTVKVNSGAKELNNGNTLTLTDTLGAALALRMDSVVISDTNTGAEVLGATYAYDPVTRQITFRLPDKRAITITYKASVQLAPGQDFGDLGSNRIVLEGFENSGGDKTTNQTGKVTEAQGGMSDSSHALQIYKYADGDSTKPLNGAKFTVEALTVDKSDADNPNAWKQTGAETITGNLQSGTSGYTQTVGLRADTIYKVTETTAPEGYTKSDTPLYVVFPGQDQDKGVDYYTGKTVDGQPLTVAAAGNVTLQTYLWPVSNDSAAKGKFKLDKKDEQGAWVADAEFTLTKDGDSTFKQVQTTKNGESLLFENLAPGTYTLTETKAPKGYTKVDPITVTVSNAGKVIVNGKEMSDKDGEHLTVTDRSDVTSFRATKVWDDNENQDGGRGTVVFHLMKSVGGSDLVIVPGQDRTIPPSADKTTVEWNNLPVREGGKEVTYSVTETYTAADGDKGEYTQGEPQCTTNAADNVRECVITNTHTPVTTKIGVTKVWNDDNNSDGSRPDSVTVQLYANGKAIEGKTVTLNDGNKWKAGFTGLPKYADGEPIVYTVQETPVPNGYTVAVTGSADSAKGFTVTNTHYPDNTKVYLSKRDLGGTEIAGAEMKLTGKLDDGTKFKTETWTSKAGESKEFALEPGTYTLTETKAPAGYYKADPIEFTVTRDELTKKLEVRVKGQVQDGNVVVMTDVYQPTDVQVSKVSLTGGVGEIAGATLTITGTTLAGKTIDPFTWTSRKGKTQTVTLQPGSYVLHESESPSGYLPARDIAFTIAVGGKITITSDDEDVLNGSTITMTDELNKTDVTVSKVAVSGVAELPGAQFKLTGTTFEGDDSPFSGEDFKDYQECSADSAKATDAAAFDCRDASGRYLQWQTKAGGPTTFKLPNGTYTLTETKAPTGYDVINTTITFTVLNGKVIVDEKAQNGNMIRVENATKAYTSVSVTKRWEDNGNSDGYRKDKDGVYKLKVFAILYRNGKAMADVDQCGTDSYASEYCVELNVKNNWTYDWTGLDRNDDQGERYSYTVDEKLVDVNADEHNADKYHQTIVKKQGIDGAEFTMYNIHKPDAQDIELVKNWDDKSDQDGKRPQSIQVTVKGTSKRPKTDGTEGQEEYTETLVVTDLKMPENNDDPNTWKWTLENLPKNNAYGNPYTTYTVTETAVAYYNGYDEHLNCTVGEKKDGCNVTFTEQKATGDSKTPVYEITNTHTPETVNVAVNKVWDDTNDFNGLRPKRVTLWLLSSVWQDSSGKNIVNGWPTPQADKCESSNKNVYGVSCIVLDKNGEVKDTSAKSDSTGDTGTSGDGSDSSVDTQSADADESTGNSGSTDVTATDNNTWSYTFTNLPKYYKGKEVVYTLTEEAVNDYTASTVEVSKSATTDGQSDQTATVAEGDTAGGASTEPKADITLTLKNTDTPDYTQLDVTKAWVDNDNSENKRPTEIHVQVYEVTTGKLGTTATAFSDAAGTGDTGTVTPGISFTQNTNTTGLVKVEGQKATLSESNNWHATFTNLNAHKQYTVREVDANGNIIAAVDGYQPPIITGNQDGKGYTITNTIIPTLPNTGGEGLARTMLFGLAFIAISGAFLASQLRDGNGMMIGGTRRNKHGKKGGAR